MRRTLLVLMMLVAASLVNAEEPRTIVQKAQPTYPEIAKRLNVSGVVIVQVNVGADGKIKGAKVMSGPVLLNDAALQAARRFVFAPGNDETRTLDFKFVPLN